MAAENEIDWSYCRDGSVADASQKLRRVIGAFGRRGRWRHMKVGYTWHPRNRWYEYRDAGWQDLFPLYQTECLDDARTMEKYLIHYCNNIPQAFFLNYNVSAGKSGRVAVNAAEYYVYVAVARRYVRFTKGLEE